MPSTSLNLDQDILDYLDRETEERCLDNRSQTARVIFREDMKRKES